MSNSPPGSPPPSRWVAWTRDIGSFLLGSGLLAHEALFYSEPRWEFLGLAAALLGLPATLLTDRVFGKPPRQEPPS